MVGKKNLANTLSCQSDDARVPEGSYAATILTVCCTATFYLKQLYGATYQEDEIFEDVPLDTLAGLIVEGQADLHTAKEACTALGLPRSYLAKEHSVIAMLLSQYQSQLQQHNGLLYYHM
jgi:hypothetical protein